MDNIVSNNWLNEDALSEIDSGWDEEIDWANSPDVIQEIANYVFTSKYARYLPKLQRRETWDEAVDRVQNMHLKKFKGDKLTPAQRAKIRWAYDKVRDRKVIPSMRGLQYSGPAIETKNPRMFNCAVVHVDKIRTFAEVFFLLLCGCGVGLGLTKKFTSRIPPLVGAVDRTGTIVPYIIEDTIEGWADSVETLLLCYTKNNPFSGRKVAFDYSRIRPKGAPLKIGGGRAPGYQPLKAAHLKIKVLLEQCIEERGQEQLRPIDAYDILMHLSDAVLSGGVRRSACLTIFDKDDDEMLAAKTGNWFEDNPQRARSNNSVLLLRNNLGFEEFQAIMQRTREFGEPGAIFASHEDTLLNPCCLSQSASILTPNGIRTIGDIEVGDSIWSETGWTNVTDKWSNGIKKIFKYETTAGRFYGTSDHRLISNGTKIPAEDCESIDILTGPMNLSIDKLIPEVIMDGLVFGDGTVHRASNDLVCLCIGKNDHDYFDSEISDLIINHRPGISPYFYTVRTNILAMELPKTYERIVPERYIFSSPETVASFLRGIYSANGSVVRDRVTLKTSSKKVCEDIQLMLSSLGIRSYYTNNKEMEVLFGNGTYTCKESWDLNISVDRERFYRLIGFIQGYKNEKLETVINTPHRFRQSKVSYDIKEVEYISIEEVFDITVDNDTHTFWTGGLNVSNCEVGFIPVTTDGRTGVQMCNLTSINGALVNNEQDYMEASEAAAIIGSLQATYTDFPYLSSAAEELTREEALLGVSMTAILEKPTILLDPILQQRAAAKTVETNKEWAKTLGINPAARITLCKPEGSGSLALGTMASGIHAPEDHWMFRRIQANKIDPVYLHFKGANPHMCEESVWSANNTDDVITFPVRVPDSSMVKRDLDALTHLDMIKSTQQNWVLPGTTSANKKPVTHSISCTVLVKDHEWEQVTNYLYLNRSFFSAVSLLPDNGGKIYQQAPVESVGTEEEFQHFKDLLKSMQHVDYSALIEYEDVTELNQELACGGPDGGCELR